MKRVEISLTVADGKFVVQALKALQLMIPLTPDERLMGALIELKVAKAAARARAAKKSQITNRKSKIRKG